MAVAAAAQASQREQERADGEAFSLRQREVLDAVLSLMVEEGDSFSMATALGMKPPIRWIQSASSSAGSNSRG